ncbi:hypothetical protein CEXT_806621 [Caerostris extrusa]|uniref:Uncharacterized protein n=1 Tax=Caerostris extrusa TaxID=172846 RepID=A0AAV4UCC4_CAEEX|nr:hypothetical protein CEXT_806621 [Caerostris extrusa]
MKTNAEGWNEEGVVHPPQSNESSRIPWLHAMLTGGKCLTCLSLIKLPPRFICHPVPVGGCANAISEMSTCLQYDSSVNVSGSDITFWGPTSINK